MRNAGSLEVHPYRWALQGIIFCRVESPRHIRAVPQHGGKFKQIEGLATFPNPFLPVEYVMLTG